jgi:hypothetical protein
LKAVVELMGYRWIYGVIVELLRDAARHYISAAGTLYSGCVLIKPLNRNKFLIPSPSFNKLDTSIRHVTPDINKEFQFVA